MRARIRRFNELTTVRSGGHADSWIVNSGRHQGLFGPDDLRIWQFMEDGTLRIGDVRTKKFTASRKIEFDDPAKVRVFSGAERLWIVPFRDIGGDAVAFDLADAEIVARFPELQCSSADLGRVTRDGSLIMQQAIRIEDAAYTRLLGVDARSQETTDGLIRSVMPTETFSHIDFFTSSPCGKWWLKPDHTHFPMVERQETPDGPVRKYYGLTIQVWSAFPVKFERRIIVAWLKAEDLPDETRILRADALSDFKKQLHAEKSQPSKPQTGLTARLFGRRGISDGPTDPDQRYRAILAASAPERDRIYTAISQALHRPGADPEAEFPARDAFGEAACDDDLWRAITKNFGPLFRDTLSKVVGWDGEDVVWFDRLGHLICAGMDGAVSPQIWFERAGLQHMMRPFPNLPGKLDVLDGRRLLAVRVSTNSIGRAEDGTMPVDGSPAETRFEPVRISKCTDGRQGPESVPAHYLYDETDRKLIDEYRKNRSTIRIPLGGNDKQSRIEAILAYRDLLDASFLERATDSSIDVCFTAGKKLISETEFFLGVKPEDREWAVAPLHDLVATYAELARQHGLTIYQKDQEQGSLLAQAARRLGELDEASLPTLIAYGEGIDGGHEYYFAGDTMPAIVATHGWTDSVTAFVAWVLAFNFYNTYDRPSTIWRNIGLGAALVQRPAEEAADFVHAHLGPLVKAGRLDWQSFAVLNKELGDSMSDWEREFFNRLIALAGETAFELR